MIFKEIYLKKIIKKKNTNNVDTLSASLECTRKGTPKRLHAQAWKNQDLTCGNLSKIETYNCQNGISASILKRKSKAMYTINT